MSTSQHSNNDNTNAYLGSNKLYAILLSYGSSFSHECCLLFRGKNEYSQIVTPYIQITSLLMAKTARGGKLEAWMSQFGLETEACHEYQILMEWERQGWRYQGLCISNSPDESLPYPATMVLSHSLLHPQRRQRSFAIPAGCVQSQVTVCSRDNHYYPQVTCGLHSQ